MTKRTVLTLALGILAGLLVAGCQRPEGGPAQSGGTATSGPAKATSTKAPGATEAAAAKTESAEPALPEGFEVVFDADCKWLEEVANKEMASALTRTDKIDVVYGHNDPSAHGAYMAAVQEGKGREKQIAFVGIDALPHEGVKYVKDGILAATFEYPTGGAEAIKAAIRVLSGEQVPKKIALGTRVFSQETVDAGGTAVAPDKKEGVEGAEILDATPLPALPKKVLIGYSQCNRAEPWRVKMDADVTAAAEAVPEITLIAKDAQNKSEQQQADVRDFIAQKVALIIISPKEAQPLSGPVEEAMKAGIPVIVLDRALTTESYTCFIGGDNVAIGREAGKWVRKAFPNGARIVELRGLATTVPSGDRHRGFLEGLSIQ